MAGPLRPRWVNSIFLRKRCWPLVVATRFNRNSVRSSDRQGRHMEPRRNNRFPSLSLLDRFTASLPMEYADAGNLGPDFKMMYFPGLRIIMRWLRTKRRSSYTVPVRGRIKYINPADDPRQSAKSGEHKKHKSHPH